MSEDLSHHGKMFEGGNDLQGAASPGERFYTAKVRFLSALLEHPAIFFTQFFHARCETTARENIKRYIAKLKAAGYG